ncbi:MAG TPA: SRPBCC domain-containing protein [Vineibacter sp.]|nr:SRPBCC domain-containing protein [Vineibacter sp.]
MSAKVMVAVTVVADPATAFEIFTQEVDAWWRHGPRYRFRGKRSGTMRFEPGVGGRLVEVYDDASGDLYEVGKILTWEPGARLAFEWRGPNYRPGQVTMVEVRFIATQDGTRVVVEHSGWESLPTGHPARHGMNEVPFLHTMAGWWQEQLADLKTHGRRTS